MADNDIEYRVNVSSAQAALKSLESAAANVGKTAAKGGKEAQDAINQFEAAIKKAGTTFESVNDRAYQSNQRYLNSLEKRVALEGKSGVDKLIAERDQLSKRFGQNAEQLARFNAQYEKLIALERASSSAGGQGAGMLALRGARDLFEGRTAYGEVQIGKSLAALATGGNIAIATLGGLAAVIAGTEVASYKAAESIGNYGAEIHRLQLVTGLTAVQVQQVGFAAKASGVEVDILQRVMRGLTQAVEDDTAKGQKAREVLRSMGVDVVGLRMGTVGTMEAFTQLSTAFEKAPTVWSRNKEALDLLNRAGINSVAMLTDFNKHMKESADIHFQSDSAIRQFVQIHDELTKASEVWDQFMIRLKTDLAKPFILTMRVVREATAPSDVHERDLFDTLARNGIQMDRDRASLRGGAGYIGDSTDIIGAALSARMPGAPKQDVYESFTTTLNALKGNNLDSMKAEATRLKGAYEEMMNSGGVDKNGNLITGTQLTSAAGAASVAEARVKAQERYNAALESTTEALKKFHVQMDQLGISQKIPITKAQGAYNEFERAHPDATLAQRTEAYEASLPAYKAEIQEIRKAALDAGNAEMRKLGKELLEAPIKEHPDDRVFTQGLTRQREQLEPETKDLLAAYRESLSFEQEMASGKGRIARTLGGKGDTIQAAQEMAAERKSILQEDLQFQLSAIDTVSQTQRMIDAETAKIKEKYVRDNAKVELELAEQVATRERQQLDEIKKTATSLYTTLFEHPSKFPHQLANVAKTAALQPVIGGLSEMTARALYPLIFGEGGTGGLAGASRSIFGGASRSIFGGASVTDGALHVLVVGGTAGGEGGTGTVNITSGGGGSGGSFNLNNFTGLGTTGYGGMMATMARMAPMLQTMQVIGGAGSSGPAGSVSSSISFPGGDQGVDLGTAVYGFGGGVSPSTSSLGGLGGGGLPSSTGGNFNPLALLSSFTKGGGSGGGGGFKFPSLSSLKSSFFNKTLHTDLSGTATNPDGPLSNIAGVLTSPASGQIMTSVGLPLALAGLTGVNRGTGTGIGEATAGGALTGAGIGTMIFPGIGTAIGAGVGAAAGLTASGIEALLGVQSDRQKAIEQVRSVYHINISNSTADSIAKIAQSKYGDNVSIAVRSPEVRQMLGLYAAGTGQASKFPQSADIPMGGSLVSQGGTLMQSPVYQYGNPYTYSSSLPVAGGNAGGNLPNPGGSTIASASFNIGGASVASFMNGEVFTPEATAGNMQTAWANSAGRTSSSMTMNDPTGIVG